MNMQIQSTDHSWNMAFWNTD